MLASESSHDFGRTWLRRLDHRRVNRCLFQLSKHLHRRMPTIRCSAVSHSIQDFRTPVSVLRYKSAWLLKVGELRRDASREKIPAKSAGFSGCSKLLIHRWDAEVAQIAIRVDVATAANRIQKSSRRVVYLRATERDPNSAKRDCLMTSEIRARAHCYEEGSVRGVRLSATKPADTPVNAPRREFTLSAFCISCLSRKGFRRS